MATGDDATAAGIPLVAAVDDVREGYNHHNATRDIIAQRTSAVTPITKGGTGATTAAAARTNLGAVAQTQRDADVAAINAALAGKQPNLGFEPVRKLYAGGVGIQYSGGDVIARIDSTDLALRQKGDGQFGGTPIYTPHGRANPVTSGFAVAYLNTDGRLAISSSSRRYKKEIKAWAPERQAVLAMQLVTFRYRKDYGDDQQIEVGVIAEELHDLGLDWLVIYEDAERTIPQGVHYERIALALLPLVQEHDRRLTQLEERLDRMETPDA